MTSHQHPLDELVRLTAPSRDQQTADLIDDEAKRALFEQIVATPIPLRRAAPVRPPHRRFVLAGAAVALVGLGGAVTLVQAGAADRDPAGGGGNVAAVPTSPPPVTGPVGSGETASCAFPDDARSIAAHAAFAFDGTVIAITPDPSPPRPGDRLVTFAVHQWFRGPGGGRATVSMWQPFSDNRSADEQASSEHGFDYGLDSRLLVSGPATRDAGADHPTAWACGFTRPYDAAVVSGWVRAFDAK